MVGVFSSSFCCHCYDCYSKPFLFIAEQHNDGIPMFPMWTSKETLFSPQIYRTMEHTQRLATKLFLMSFWRKRPLKRTEFLVRIQNAIRQNFHLVFLRHISLAPNSMFAVRSFCPHFQLKLTSISTTCAYMYVCVTFPVYL